MKSIGAVLDAPPASPTLGGFAPFASGGGLAGIGGAASTTGERAAAVATTAVATTGLAAELTAGAEAGASVEERAHPAEIAVRRRRYRIMLTNRAIVVALALQVHEELAIAIGRPTGANAATAREPTNDRDGRAHEPAPEEMETAWRRLDPALTLGRAGRVRPTRLRRRS
jgi:hypothetical protein